MTRGTRIAIAFSIALGAITLKFGTKFDLRPVVAIGAPANSPSGENAVVNNCSNGSTCIGTVYQPAPLVPAVAPPPAPTREDVVQTEPADTTRVQVIAKAKAVGAGANAEARVNVTFVGADVD